MAGYREGQTATNPKTGQKLVYTNGQWVNGSVAGGPVHNIDPTSERWLNDLTSKAQEANEVKATYQNADASIKRLQPSPFKGALMDAATPEQGGGFWDKLGGLALGAPAKALGILSDQNVDDFQRLKGLANQRVLAEQTLQKGPQTESDAARMAMTDISPYKSVKANEEVIGSGLEKVQRTIGRAPFYTAWANKYGLNGLNEQGQSAEQAYQAQLNANQPAKAATAPSGWKVVGVK